MLEGHEGLGLGLGLGLGVGFEGLEHERDGEEHGERHEGAEHLGLGVSKYAGKLVRTYVRT